MPPASTRAQARTCQHTLDTQDQAACEAVVARMLQRDVINTETGRVKLGAAAARIDLILSTDVQAFAVKRMPSKASM